MKLYDKDNHEIGTGTAGDDGVATITVANNIPVGDVTAKATDASGNVSDPSAPKGATDTTKPNAPEITTDLTGKANTKTPIVVTAEPGSTVVVSVGDKVIGSGTADETGSVTITPTEDIPVGDVTATATDGSGNKSNPSDAKKATDGLVNPPVVDTPEFNGGVNGELPGPIPSLELTIEVRWIDEDGNVLKPSVKTGNEKNAEHGSIPGYEFVRTVIDENEPVITHIFRKVSSNTTPIPVAPVPPATNGNSGQDAPAPTTPIPDAVTPNADQVDTKTTIDNGAKSNDSQNVLPNTGTESNATFASLGLLGLLSGFGLVARKKKED